MPEAVAREATPEPAPAPAVEPAPGSSPSDAAAAAYRAAIEAYNAGNAEGYFGAFVDPLRCFHGRADHSLGELRTARASRFGEDARAGALFIASLETLRSSEDEVVLVDRGAWWSWLAEDEVGASARPYLTSSSDPIEQGVHEKIVVMRRVNGAWRIAAETDREHAGCAAADLEIPPLPDAIAQCRAAHQTCLRECDGTCRGCGACNSCNECPGACLASLSECVGAGEGFLP